MTTHRERLAELDRMLPLAESAAMQVDDLAGLPLVIQAMRAVLEAHRPEGRLNLCWEHREPMAWPCDTARACGVTE